MALSTVVLLGDYRGPDAVEPSGLVEIQVATRVAGDQIVPAGITVTGKLDHGLLTQPVVLSGPQLSGPLLLRITERIGGAPAETYLIEPLDQGDGTCDLRTAIKYTDPGLTGYLPATARGAAYGVAPLDGAGQVPAIHLPPGNGGGGLVALSAADGTIVVGGTADHPTLRVGTVPAAQVSGLASVATTGGIASTTGSLPANRVSGLASVATTGNLSDLSGALPAGQVSGLASVATSGSFADLSGMVPASALPALAISEVFTAASQAAMLALTAQRGDVAIRLDLDATFILAADDPSTAANWKQLPTPPDAVLSVAGRTGVVVLGVGDVTGLQTALDAKVPATRQVIAGAGLTGGGTLSADRTLSVEFGADSGTAVEGDDPRLSDARPPTAHTHTISDVTSLQAALDGKAPTGDYATNTALAGRLPLSTFTTKGDLVVASGSGAAVRVGVGSPGQMLTPNPAAAAGVEWAAPPAGGGATTSAGDLYPPSSSGIAEWSADPALCTQSWGLSSGTLILMRVHFREALTLAQIGVVVVTAGVGPGAYSGAAIYEDGQGTINRLAQSADAGATFTTAGSKTIPLTGTQSIAAGDYRWIGLLFQGGNPPTIAGPAASVSPATLNIGARRCVYAGGQTGFPSTLDVAAMSLNNATYFINFRAA